MLDQIKARNIQIYDLIKRIPGVKRPFSGFNNLSLPGQFEEIRKQLDKIKVATLADDQKAEMRNICDSEIYKRYFALPDSDPAHLQSFGKAKLTKLIGLMKAKTAELNPVPVPPPVPAPAIVRPREPNLTAFVTLINDLSDEIKKAPNVKGLDAKLVIDPTKPKESLEEINQALTLLSNATKEVAEKDELAKKVEALKIKSLCEQLQAQHKKFLIAGTTPLECLGVPPAPVTPELTAASQALLTQLAELNKNMTALNAVKNPKFTFRAFGSLNSSSAVFNPALQINLAGVSLTQEQVGKIKDGLTLYAANIPISINYDPKTGLTMRLAKNQGQYSEEQRQQAALHLMVTAFANSVKEKPIVISGEDQQLVAFAIAAANYINSKLDKDKKRKIEVPPEVNSKLDYLTKEGAEKNFDQIIKKTPEFEKPDFWKNLCSDISAAERDLVFKHGR